MNTEIRKNINTVGKIGRIIASILAVLMIIAAVALTAVTAVVATLPAESVNITLNGSADISSQGELFAKFKKVFSIKQEGDSAKIDLAQSGSDVNFRIADSGDILEDADLSETENGYRLDIADKKISVGMRKILYGLVISVFEIICTAVVLFMLRSLMKSLEKCETPFGADVITRMKKFGYSLIPFFVLRSASKSAWDSVIKAKDGTVGFGLDIDLTVILGILIILMLVMIFSYGAQLQKESDETL